MVLDHFLADQSPDGPPEVSSPPQDLQILSSRVEYSITIYCPVPPAPSGQSEYFYTVCQILQNQPVFAGLLLPFVCSSSGVFGSVVLKFHFIVVVFLVPVPYYSSPLKNT